MVISITFIFYLPEAQFQYHECMPLFKIPTTTAIFIENEIQTKTGWELPEKPMSSSENTIL